MNIAKFSFKNYRNLQDASLEPGCGVNVIFGDNAQGKTNFLEGLWVFSGGRSFRGARDSELVAFSEINEKSSHDCRLMANVNRTDRMVNLQVDILQGRRKASVNGVILTSPSQLVGNMSAVVFAPVHLSLVKEGPALRRKFMDAAICQITPSYGRLLAKYKYTVAQRRALLRDIRSFPQLMDTMDVWEEKIAEIAAVILLKRLKYMELLREHVQRICLEISRDQEDVRLNYKVAMPREMCDLVTVRATSVELCGIFKSVLKNQRCSDIATGVTSVGPHRDDFEVCIGGVSARQYASQGQQRSVVLALKLSEAAILQELRGDRPVILLDDVMSELDSGRQDYVLNSISGFQVFITCCEPSSTMNLSEGRVFEVKSGVIFDR